MNAYEQDCIIASEFGYAQAMGTEVTIQTGLSCPICQHEQGWLEIIRNEEYIVCFGCGNIYAIEVTPQTKLESELAVAALAAERALWLDDERATLEDCQR